MLDISKLKIAKIIVALQRSIESVLGESYKTFTDAVNAVNERAKSDNMWYEATKTWTSYAQRFSGSKIKEFPRMSFENAINCEYLLASSEVETIPYRIGGDKVTNYNRACYNCKNLKFVKGVACQSATSFSNTWYDCNALETILEPFEPLEDKVDWANAFVRCEKLRDIRFAKNCIRSNISFGWSILLSEESVQSIIDGLATVETTQTLTVSSNVFEKLTDEQHETANTKNWIIR